MVRATSPVTPLHWPMRWLICCLERTSHPKCFTALLSGSTANSQGKKYGWKPLPARNLTSFGLPFVIRLLMLNHQFSPPLRAGALEWSVKVIVTYRPNGLWAYSYTLFKERVWANIVSVDQRLQYWTCRFYRGCCDVLVTKGAQ